MYRIFFLSFLVFAFSCGSAEFDQEAVFKIHPGDPFASSVVKSQLFEVSGDNGEVIQGEMGTKIVVPEGAFVNANGEEVYDDITIELAEALRLDQMVLSNLTTTSEGELLQSDGMIYLNASANGETLRVNPNKPIYIEIPTEKRIPGMMTYEGVRDEKGNMDWVNPSPIEQYLTKVDLDLLNFLPLDFAGAVQLGLPFRNHDTLSQSLVDSLFYSLSQSDGAQLLDGLNDTDVNEAYYNDFKIKDGKYRSDSYLEEGEHHELMEIASVLCGIDPAIIKVIRNEKFQNTFIATKEFESRLPYIYASCLNEVLELYINNLDKDLYEVDALVYELIEADYIDQGIPSERLYETSHAAEQFESLGHTNVDGGKEYSELLGGFYEKQLKKVEKELKKLYKTAMKSLAKKNEIAEEVIEEYQELLFERESDRMETYGFIWDKKMGWINIDVGTEPKDWGQQPLEVELSNDFESPSYVYIFYPSISSLYRLNDESLRKFYVGNANEKAMLMPKQTEALLIGISYQGNNTYYAEKVISAGENSTENLTLELMSMDEVETKLAEYDDFGEHNSITADLHYMRMFEIENQRQEVLKQEAEWMYLLWEIVNPCCQDRKFILEDDLR